MADIKIVQSLEEDWKECESIVNDPSRRDRMQEMKEENKFYFNAQWDGDEEEELSETGQVDITLNAMRRAFRTLIAQIVGPQPTAKFMPRDAIPGDEQEKAMQEQVHSLLTSLQGLWNHCWYISDGTIRLRRSVQSQIITGLGWIGIELDPKQDYFRGELVFKDKLPWEMVVPLNASEIDFSDAHKMWYRTLVPLASAARRLKGDADLVTKLRTHAYVTGMEEDYDIYMLAPDGREVYNEKIKKEGDYYDEKSNIVVEWFEMDEKVDVDAKLFKAQDENGFVETLVYISDEQKKEFDPEKLLIEKGYKSENLESIDITVPRIKRTKYVGRDIQIEEPEILPISKYPNKPIIDEDTYNPLPYGEAHFVKPAQKLLNKTFSLATLHLQTSGSGDRLVGFKGAFGDTPTAVENFQKHFAHPASATELGVEWAEGLEVGKMFQRMQATPLQPAAVQIIQLLTGWIDRLTGIDPMAFGNTSGGAPRTLGATLSIKEWGDENARIPIMHMSSTLQNLGETWLEWALIHYRHTKSFSVPDHNQKLNQYTINTADNQGYIQNNFEGLRANIFVTSGATLMLNRFSQLQMFKELIPLSPVFAKLFLQYSDLPDKFDLIDEIDYTKQLEEQAQQMAQQLEQLQGLAEGLTKKVQEGEQKIELTKFKGALDSLLTKIRERLNATLKQQQKATSDFEQAQRKQQEG